MSSAKVISYGNGERPWFFTEEGEKKLEVMRKELETYVKVLNANPALMMKTTSIQLNRHTLLPEEVGEKQAKEIKQWWDDKKTDDAIRSFIFKRNHKVNGKIDNWNAGGFGSRWADTKMNGRLVRIAFYSKKSDDGFKEAPKDYYWILDASH
jgi:hypothetical protein